MIFASRLLSKYRVYKEGKFRIFMFVRLLWEQPSSHKLLQLVTDILVRLLLPSSMVSIVLLLFIDNEVKKLLVPLKDKRLGNNTKLKLVILL